MSSPKTKTPIKNLPVRTPGQGLGEQLQDILAERILGWGLFAACVVAMAAGEWVRALTDSPPAPWVLTTFAVIAVGVALWHGRRAYLEAKNYHLGMVGERAVGQYLEEKLRPMGCQVLHDIPGEGFNVDHVVIGPTGIYCIETKTCSKPVKGIHNVQYDGEKVTVNGFTPDRDPVVQVKAARDWLRDLIEESTGKRFPIRPVILYPGWYVEKMPANANVWVLNEKAAITFIQNAKPPLPPEDVNLVTYHLKRYVIAEMEKGAGKG